MDGFEIINVEIKICCDLERDFQNSFEMAGKQHKLWNESYVNLKLVSFTRS